MADGCDWETSVAFLGSPPRMLRPALQHGFGKTIGEPPTSTSGVAID
jgi:hypothetical protein